MSTRSLKLRNICFLVFIGLCGCFYFKSQIGNSSRVPVSYEECMNTSEKYSFDGRSRDDLVCDFVVKGLWAVFLNINDLKLLEQCQEMNGVKCAHGRCCLLTYYNSDYSFPHSLEECLKNKKMSADHNYCEVVVSSFAYDQDVANKLLSQCGELVPQYRNKESSDAMFIENSQCSLTFFR